MDDFSIIFGGEVKALGGGKIAGQLVQFSDADNPDLSQMKDFFDAKTDLDFEDGQKVSVYFHHGMDETLGARKLGRVEMKANSLGVFVEGVLNMRDEYEKALYELAAKNKLSWSSGAPSHLVRREKVEGKDAHHISHWPIAEASLTPCPADYRNQAYTSVKGVSFKSLLAEIVAEEADAEEAAAEQPQEQSAPEAETPEAVKAADTDALLDALEALPLKTFLEAMGAVASLTDRRLAWYAEQRETKQGRAISAENLAKMRDIHAGMQKHAADLGDIIARHSLNIGHSAGAGDGAARRPETPAAGNSQSSGNKPKPLGSEMGAAFMRFMQAHGGTATLAAPTAGQSVP